MPRSNESWKYKYIQKCGQENKWVGGTQGGPSSE